MALATETDFDPVLNVAQAPAEGTGGHAPWGGHWKVLTPRMRELGNGLGVIQNTLPPGSIGCPFLWHAREDEIFFVHSGRGVLRYGDMVREISVGDCISCPAGSRVAHQIANPFDEDLVYLAIGPYDPHEVCGYPDNGKVFVRAIGQIGRLDKRPYMDGEPDPPLIFGLAAPDRDLSD